MFGLVISPRKWLSPYSMRKKLQTHAFSKTEAKDSSFFELPTLDEAYSPFSYMVATLSHFLHCKFNVSSRTEGLHALLYVNFCPCAVVCAILKLVL